MAAIRTCFTITTYGKEKKDIAFFRNRYSFCIIKETNKEKPNTTTDTDEAAMKEYPETLLTPKRSHGGSQPPAKESFPGLPEGLEWELDEELLEITEDRLYHGEDGLTHVPPHHSSSSWDALPRTTPPPQRGASLRPAFMKQAASPSLVDLPAFEQGVFTPPPTSALQASVSTSASKDSWVAAPQTGETHSYSDLPYAREEVVSYVDAQQPRVGKGPQPQPPHQPETVLLLTNRKPTQPSLLVESQPRVVYQQVAHPYMYQQPLQAPYPPMMVPQTPPSTPRPSRPPTARVPRGAAALMIAAGAIFLLAGIAKLSYFF